MRSQLVRCKLEGLTFTSADLLVAHFGLYGKHDWNSRGQQQSLRIISSYPFRDLLHKQYEGYFNESLDKLVLICVYAENLRVITMLANFVLEESNQLLGYPRMEPYGLLTQSICVSAGC